MPIGPPVAPIAERRPGPVTLAGRHARVEPLDPPRHGPDLFEAIAGADPAMWTYMFFGPFAGRDAFMAWLAPQAGGEDPVEYAVVDAATGRAQGMVGLLRVVPQWATCEVGSIWYGPAVMRTPLSTEAMYLMARYVFEDLGYRRYEWKCDALNAPSRRAAERLGFRYEGLFRKHMVYKGRSRDTAWYAMTDDDWPTVKAALEAWLDPVNFDAEGRQVRALDALRAGLTP
ncbi:MAG: GNAT family N-acetyltransferase [Hyphomicrobiales bacterium]|nr:GNAT family N-acetyltransferase [Hyphomicrobiales bacterium]